MTTHTLLNAYYDGLAKRHGWEGTIAENFLFTGGTPNGSVNGKAAYVEVLRRFSRVFENVAVKHAIVDGDHACVIATYGVVSPSGKKKSVDIAEVWTTRDEQLESLAIYFDTASWQSFMSS